MRNKPKQSVMSSASSVLSAELDKDNDWHTVISEVSAPTYVGKLQSQQQRHPQLPKLSPMQRLVSGMIVIKHGRQGRPKSRILRVDQAGRQLSWMDERSMDKKTSILAAKSIQLCDVVKVQTGVKYVRSALGKQCTENATPTLARNVSKLEDLKLCISLVLATRTLDIQCISEEDYQDLYTAFLGLVEYRAISHLSMSEPMAPVLAGGGPHE